MDESEIRAIITGRVFDERGKPVGGAVVTCDGMDTRTLFDGSFRFEDLELGPYTVEIDLEGYRKQRREVVTMDEEEAVLDFKLETEVGDAKIFGYVISEETGEPLNVGGSVYMFRLTSNRNTPIDPRTGRFEFSSLSQGTYTIWTSVLDYEDNKKTVTVEEGEERREDFFITKADIEPPLG
jgi:hypothetical protein